MRRHAPRDDRRERIGGLPPGRAGWVGVTAEGDRLLVEAVLHRCRAGIPRRDLPERPGAREKVRTRFARRARAGGRARVFRHLAGGADDEHAMVDSTVVRARRHGAGAPKRRDRATRRSGAAGAA